MSYVKFFTKVTGHPPFPYQVRFRDDESSHVILKAPTGLGKSDTVLTAWLHRLATDSRLAARRLVWCLPGRTLAEQMYSVATERVRSAGLGDIIHTYRLLGGSADNDVTLAPDQPAILVGTQDILLSRALNRGYARRPFRWPIDFALLNNDCWWVLDEVQLLGDGLATSTQLAAFRERFGCFGLVRTCWISATFDPAWLRTVDLISTEVRTVEPDKNDRAVRLVRERLVAKKSLEQAPQQCRLPSGVADFCATEHRPNTLSLIVVNTVARAREIYIALDKKTNADLVLLHSRFRANDRMLHTQRLNAPIPPEGRIVVATQVVEAGIDISADLLITDIAPYSSLVQRFGRVNRYGERPASRIYWVDRPLTAKRKTWVDAPTLKPREEEEIARPYSASSIALAMDLLRSLHSASPDDLPPVYAPEPWEHVLRRADLLDLFDTSPDLAGNEIDISRFVRSSEDRDVYIAWRDWAGDNPPADLSDLDEGELCPAPINEVRAFIKRRDVWYWNAVEARWKKPENIYPGITLLLRCSSGGYTSEYGWFPDSTAGVPPARSASNVPSEAIKDDALTYVQYRQTLPDHSDGVVEAVKELLESLSGLGLEPHTASIQFAARAHDWGKAHPVMQETLHNGPGPYAEILAKQTPQMAARGHSVPFFRHELASAIAILGSTGDRLAAYVAAAHHGRVRVSIRSMPGERNSGGDIARGIREGDVLLPADLGGGIKQPAVTLSLALMSLGRTSGGESWTDGVLRLRDSLGPFRLAYLEMLLRAADELASRRKGSEVACSA